MLRIDYVPAPAGAGKTYGAAHLMRKRVALGEKFILVQPITRLIGETVQTTFAREGIDPSYVTEISERTYPDGGITRAVIRHINNALEGRGEILVITHAAFLLLTEMYSSFRDRWIVIIDEALTVQEAISRKLPNSHAVLTEHFEVTSAFDPTYWTIGKKRGSTKLDAIARNRGGDEVYDRLQPLAAAVVSKHRTVHVRADRYSALLAEAEVRGVPRQLDAFLLLSPSALKGWRQVIVMAANFTATPMYLIWSRVWGETVMFNDITKTLPLRYTEHCNGHLLDIHYGFEQRWSKEFAAKPAPGDEGGRTRRDVFVDAVCDRIADQQVAVLANNDLVGIEKRFKGGVRLPAYTHGLNTFSHYDAAVLLLAANPTPAVVAFLKHVADLTDEEIATAIHMQSIYQGALRISLRDPDSMTAKILFVPDRATAEYLHTLFPGSRIHRLDLGLAEVPPADGKAGRPKVYASPADRQRAYRGRQEFEKFERTDRDLRLRLVNGFGIADRFLARAEYLADDMTETLNIADAAIDRGQFHGTLFQADLSANVGHVEPYAAFDDFAADLRDLSREKHAHKDDCWLWSPACYVPLTRNTNPGATRCGSVNVAYARHIILDNDGGDLAPEQFAALFPGLRMVIYSTWSSTAARPKWRVIIETDLVLDIEGYRLVTARIIALLAERGFHDAKEIGRDPTLALRKGFMGAHGFDRSKLNPVSRLFMPSRGAYPPDAFFLDCVGGQRAALPVFEWVDACPVPERPVAPPRKCPAALAAPNPMADSRLQRLQAALLTQNAITFPRRKEHRVEAALDWWALEGDRDRQRDRNFFSLAGRLYRAGCDRTEFEAHLTAAAAAARRSKADLREKIPRLWKFVARWDR